MTCPHCGFENTEDRGVCFRCGQGLDLSDVEIVPPRLRRGAPGSPLAERAVRWWNRRHAWRRNLSRCSPLAAFLASLVPGLGHALQGEARRGLGLALVWSLCVLLVLIPELPAAWRWGYLPEWLLRPRLVPLTVHAWIMAEAYARRVGSAGRRPGLPERVGATAVAVLLLVGPWALGVLPGQRHYQVVASGVAFREAGIDRADRLLVDRTGLDPARIPVGSLVLYLAPWSHAQGQMMGRVLAGPGARVQWQQATGQLLLDGRAGFMEGFERLPDTRFELTEGKILVLPALRGGLRSWEDLVVDRESIRGVAVEVIEPRSRRRNLSTR